MPDADGRLADEGFQRVVILHHPPVAGAVVGRKKLSDQEAFRAVLARRGAELVLHGHAHEALVATVPGPDGAAIPVLGVPSASARGTLGRPAARWHLIEVEEDRSIRVVARGLEDGVITELGRFSL